MARANLSLFVGGSVPRAQRACGLLRRSIQFVSRVAARSFAVVLVLGCSWPGLEAATTSCGKDAPGPVVYGINPDSWLWPPSQTTFDVLANDSTPDHSSLVITGVSNVTGGTATPTSDGKLIVYTPATASPSTCATDGTTPINGSFTYSAQDATGFSGTALVCLTAAQVQPCITITATCQGTNCYFNAKPCTWIDWISFSFDFGDGSKENGDGPNVAHLYSNVPASGEYFTVTVTGNYSDGTKKQGSLPVLVQNVTPLVKWSGSDVGGLFFATKVDASNLPWTGTAYSFDWNDGTPQTGLTIGDGDLSNLGMTHLYAAPGLYRIILWVKQNPGQSNEIDTAFPQDITIQNNPPTPDFVGQSLNSDLNWSFTPSGYIGEHPESCAYSWDFGDGTYASGLTTAAPVSRQYSQRGNYLVTLSVRDAFGLVGTKTRLINVAPIIAQFTYTCSNTQPSCNLSPTATESGGTVQILHWDFGDGQTQDMPYGTAPVAHTFPGIGAYNVTLTALDTPYTSAPLTQRVTVNLVPNNVGLAYFTLPECRLYDSRQVANMTANVPLTVVAAGKCGIPSTAHGVAASLTILPPNGPGYLQYVNASPVTSLASYMAYQVNDTRNVQAFLTLDSTGSVGFVSTTSTSGLLIDVYGYYDLPANAPASTALGPYGYDSSTPARWFNTWDANILTPGCGTYPPIVGAAPSPGQRANFGLLRGVSPCGVVIPSHAHAAQLTFSLYKPSNAESFSLFPTGASDGGTTCLNVAANAFRTCTQIVRLYRTDGGGDVSATGQGPSQTSSQYWLGIEGYYSQLGRQLYHPIPPCRLFDTTNPALNTATQLQVFGHCGVPSDGSAQFVAATVHVLNPTGEGELWLGSQSVTTPFPVSFETGLTQISGTAVAPLTQGALQVAGFFRTPPFTGSTDYAIDIVGYFAPNTGGPLVSPGDQALFVAQSVPTAMVIGGTYPVSVTMANMGSTTWTAAGNYRLAAVGPNSGAWGLNRVYLSSTESIAPGQQRTFTFNVTAPSTTGAYNFQWQMVRENVAWVGDPTDIVPVTVAAGDQAQFVSQSVPSKMVAAGVYFISVTMSNTGSTTWTAAANYRLGRTDSVWGISRVYLGSTESIAPGQQKTFTYNVTAPSTAGNYNFQWQMVRENVAWFGTPTTNVVVNDVTGSTSQLAQCVNYWVPPVVNGNYTVKAGAAYGAFVTIQNAGTSIWTAASKYDLASQNPFNNPTWGPGLTRVYLASGDSIAQGQQKTFQFTITAPTALGQDYFQWQMIQEGVALFGDICGPAAPVNVSATGTSGVDEPSTEENEGPEVSEPGYAEEPPALEVPENTEEPPPPQPRLGVIEGAPEPPPAAESTEPPPEATPPEPPRGRTSGEAIRRHS